MLEPAEAQGSWTPRTTTPAMTRTVRRRKCGVWWMDDLRINLIDQPLAEPEFFLSKPNPESRVSRHSSTSGNKPYMAAQGRRLRAGRG
eukprot:scaffold228802_cov41-Tisochrysis_lutea.AAC.1